MSLRCKFTLILVPVGPVHGLIAATAKELFAQSLLFGVGAGTGVGGGAGGGTGLLT